MEVSLRGSSPSATTVGILLMTRARQLGLPLRAEIVGDERDVASVPGPALLYAPILASCGVGREHGQGATVVVPGPPNEPLLMSALPHGVDGWFLVDRRGNGAHAATQACVRLAEDPRVPARHLAKDLRRAMQIFGMSADPAVLDVLFSAPVPPLTRLSLALRAGRAMSGGRGEPITRYLRGSNSGDQDPLGPDFDRANLEALLRYGGLRWIVDGLSAGVRDRVEEWVECARTAAREDGGRDLVLLYALAEIGSHLVQLPSHSILPPLGAAEDSVAVSLQAALAANGDGDAARQLTQVFIFLGGRFVPTAEHVIQLDDELPPEDRIERWQWFCRHVRHAYRRAEELWPIILDPPQ